MTPRIRALREALEQIRDGNLPVRHFELQGIASEALAADTEAEARGPSCPHSRLMDDCNACLRHEVKRLNAMLEAREGDGNSTVMSVAAEVFEKMRACVYMAADSSDYHGGGGDEKVEAMMRDCEKLIKREEAREGEGRTARMSDESEVRNAVVDAMMDYRASSSPATVFTELVSRTLAAIDRASRPTR